MDAILVLEDDAANQAVFGAILRRQGFHTVAASSAQAALEACRQQRGAIGLVIADLRLPDMPGTEAARRIRQSYPHIPILFTSGTPMDCWGDAELRDLSGFPQDSYEFLPKPFTCWMLNEAVGRMMERVRLAQSA